MVAGRRRHGATGRGCCYYVAGESGGGCYWKTTYIPGLTSTCATLAAMLRPKVSRTNGPHPCDYGLSPLPALGGGGVEMPPHFECLVGYDGDGRYVSFHSRVDGRPVVGDGATERVGQYEPFAVWANHPYVWPSLATDESRDDPEPYIVLDRLTRLVYTGRGIVVRRFLAVVSGEPGGGVRIPRHITMAELDNDGRDLDPNPLDRARFERRAIPRLVEWLGGRPLPCPNCQASHVASDYGTGDDGHPVCSTCRKAFYGLPLSSQLSNLRVRLQP